MRPSKHAYPKEAASRVRNAIEYLREQGLTKHAAAVESFVNEYDENDPITEALGERFKNAFLEALHARCGICGHCGSRKCAGSASNSKLPDKLSASKVLLAMEAAVTVMMDGRT